MTAGIGVRLAALRELGPAELRLPVDDAGVCQEHRDAAAAVMSLVRAVTAELMGECTRLFARVESGQLAPDAVARLQADLKTKDCWSLAKNASRANPWRLQHFCNNGAWDEDGVRARAAVAAWVKASADLRPSHRRRLQARVTVALQVPSRCGGVRHRVSLAERAWSVSAVELG